MKRFPRLGSALSLVGCAALSLTLTGCKDPTYAKTEQGIYQGVQEETLISFKGIKYASAPTGDLRFEAPTAPAELTEITLADEFGSACPQVGGAFGPRSVNEDCLFLNVYRPLKGKDHPVMVWIHGGAFVAGSGGSDYDPVRLVEEGVVVVTLNYRLGALGFLAHAGLNGGDSGNYGLMDQQFALKWVQNNIESFGGDKDNVTIFGESAGGHSVMNHLSTPTSAGLFHKAIVQSGTYHLEDVPLATSQFLGSLLVSQTSCVTSTDMEACLKALPVEDLLTAQGADQFIPTYGNSFSPVSPLIAILSGTFSDVPLISGNNLNEATLFTALDQSAVLSNSIEAAATQAYTDAYTAEIIASGDPVAAAAAGEAAAAAATQDPLVLQAAYFAAFNTYNAANYVSAVDTLLTPFSYSLNNRSIADIAAEYLANSTGVYEAYNTLHTDWRFACTAQITADRLVSGRDLYAYHFTDENAPNAFAALGLPVGFNAGAAHASEIQYVFSDGAQFTDADQAALSEAMVDYWTAFAKTGNPNPNNSNLVAWPEYGVQGDNMLELNPVLATTSRAAFNTIHNCDYWNIPNAQ